MNRFVLLLLVLLGQSSLVNASPQCLNRAGQNLAIDNNSTLSMEQTTPNQYTTQAHVVGVISDIYPDHNGHQHFAISFTGVTGGIEVVYNAGFGDLPDLNIGMTVEACGEYITSNAATAQYPASPMGAIIHWVHKNPNQGAGAHPSGYLVINGVLCGQDVGGGSRPQAFNFL